MRRAGEFNKSLLEPWYFIQKMNQSIIGELNYDTSIQLIEFLYWILLWFPVAGYKEDVFVS